MSNFLVDKEITIVWMSKLNYASLYQVLVCNGEYDCIDRHDEELKCRKSVQEEESEDTTSTSLVPTLIVIAIAQYWVRWWYFGPPDE